MTVTLPGPLLFACVILGLPAVLVLGEARHVLRDRRRDRKTPVPGNATPPHVAAPRSQPRQTPAPGLDPRSAIPLHDTGGVDFGITRWKCGCLMSFDALGRVVGTTICTQPSDIDEELRRLLP